MTARNTGTTLTLALNYGAGPSLWMRSRLTTEMEQKQFQPERITEEDIHRHLYTAQMPIPTC